MTDQNWKQLLQENLTIKKSPLHESNRRVILVEVFHIWIEGFNVKNVWDVRERRNTG